MGMGSWVWLWAGALFVAACTGDQPGVTVAPTTTRPETPTTALPATTTTASVELQWARTGGFPVDGVFWAIAVEPGDPDRLYAAVENLGFMMTEDGGSSWHRIDPGHHWLRGLVLDPSDDTLAYYLQGQGLSVIERTTGRDLSISGLGRGFGYGPDENKATAIAIDPSGIVYLGGPNGVYRSTDQGRTIQQIGEDLPSETLYSALAIDPSNPNVLYVGTRGPWRYDIAVPEEYPARGVFRSLDGGQTWLPLSSDVEGLNINAILIHPGDSRTLYLATFDGVFKSRDGGASWVPASNGLTNREVWVLVMDPRDPDRLFAGTWGGGLFSTTDGGNSWVQTSFSGIDSHRDNIFSLAFDPNNPDTLYIGTGDGLFRYDAQGGSFSHVQGTVFWSSASYLAVHPSDPSVVYTLEGVPPGQGGRDLYRSVDGGSSWRFVGPSQPLEGDSVIPHTYGMQVHVDPSDPSTVYYSSGFGFYVSRDEGDTWSLVRTGVLPDQFHFHAFAIHPQNPDILYVGTGGGGEGEHDPRHAVFTHMLKTEDGGTRWTLIDNGLPRTNYHIWTVLVHPEDPDIAYMATTSAGWPPGMYDSTIGIYKTVNGGRSWFAVNEGLGSRDILALVFHPDDPDTLYAAATDSLYVSGDAGSSWQKFWSPERGVVATIAIDPRTPQMMFAGTWGGGGVYASVDSGDSWTPVNMGLGDQFVPDIQHLVVDPQSQTIYAAAGGVFKASYAAMAAASTAAPATPPPSDDAAGVTPTVAGAPLLLLGLLAAAAIMATAGGGVVYRGKRRRGGRHTGFRRGAAIDT